MAKLQIQPFDSWEGRHLGRFKMTITSPAPSKKVPVSKIIQPEPAVLATPPIAEVPVIDPTPNIPVGPPICEAEPASNPPLQ